MGLALWIGIVFAFSPLAARAQFDESELEELVLSIQAGQYILSDGVLAYQYQGRFYLPIIALSEEFSFFTEPDLGRGYVSGWAIAEENSFSIDVSRKEVTIRGQKTALSDTEILPEDVAGSDDLYVEQELLNKIWPIGVAVNLPLLSLDILVEEGDQKLPFMTRLERRAKQKLVSGQKEAKAAEAPKEYTYVPNPYRAIGLPILDINTETRFDTLNDNVRHMTTLNGVQDLLWAKADYTTSYIYDDDRLQKPEAIRLHLERNATRDQPLPLGFKHIEGGDVRIRHSERIQNGSVGRGVNFTTSKKSRPTEFDIITVEGIGNPGWETELYRNTQLLDFGVVDERGEYRFEDVPLLFGNNEIRVILYGPQGQIREIVENYTFGANMLPPGEFSYTVGMVDTEKDLIRFTEPDNTAGKPEGWTVTGEAAYGINRNITAYSTMTTLPTRNNEERRDYITLGSGLSLPFGVSQVEVYKDVSQDSAIENKGHAIDARFLTEIKGFRLNLRSAFFNKFESPDTGFGLAALKKEYETGVDRTFRLPFGSLGLNLTYRHSETQDKSTSTSYNTRQSLSFSGWRFTNGTTTTITNDKHQNTSGQLSASVRMRQWRFRSDLGYNIFPEREVASFNGEIRYEPVERFSAALLGTHDFISSQTGAGLQFSYDFDQFLASLDTQWMQDQGFTFALRASTSLGPYGPTSKYGSYILSAERLTSASPASARIFLDYDGDGAYSEGDAPVEGARILMNGRRDRTGADAEGNLISTAGSGSEEATIEVDRESLLDPYHVPASDGYITSLRPGSLPHFEFPIIETGAIDGLASYPDGRPLAGMRIELVNDKGDVVRTGETAYDGFYTFEYVPPGTYTVRADPSYGVNVPPQTIVVSSEELFASGIDLQLLEQAVEAEAADEAEPEGKSGGVAQPHHATGTGQPAPLPTEGSFSSVVQRVRIGEHPGSIRLVLDLSGPAQFNLTRQNAGQVIWVDLPDVAWAAIRTWQGTSTPVLSGFTVEALEGGGTRLILNGRGAISSPLNGILKPGEGMGHRLYIDVALD